MLAPARPPATGRVPLPAGDQQFVGEVHRGADVVGDQGEDRPEGGGGNPLGQAHHRVVLPEGGDDGVRIPRQVAVPGHPRRTVAAEDLAARVQDEPARSGPADDGRGDAEGQVVGGAGADRQLLGVVEHVDTGPEFTDRSGSAMGGRRGGAAAQHLGPKTPLPQRLRGLRERPFLVPGRPFAGSGIMVVALAGERERPHHQQTGLRGRLGHTARVGGRHPGPARPAVHLDQHLHPAVAAAHRVREPAYRLRRVRADPQRDLVGQPVQAARLARVQPERIGDEQVVHAGRGERLRLAQGRHRQPDRSRAQLTPRDLRALVALGVRPEGEPTGPGRLGHPCDVPVQHVRVDDQDRRDKPLGQLFHHHTSLPLPTRLCIFGETRTLAAMPAPSAGNGPKPCGATRVPRNEPRAYASPGTAPMTSPSPSPSRPPRPPPTACSDPDRARRRFGGRGTSRGVRPEGSGRRTARARH